MAGTLNGHRARLERLEALTVRRRCARCEAWGELVVLVGDDRLPPATCPACGRDCWPAHVVRIVRRDDGPQ